MASIKKTSDLKKTVKARPTIKITRTASVKELFKNPKINRLQTGAIVAHVNNLAATDKYFKAKLQKEPVETLVQFGLDRKLAAGLIAETIQNKANEVAGMITDCCCTGSITISCGAQFYKDLPAINDIKAWSKLALGK